MKQFQSQKIKEFREAQGLSQHALGEKAGLFPQQISEWERGGRNMTVKNLLVIADALGKDPSDFFVEVKKGEGGKKMTDKINHGINCEKVAHVKTGYLHGADDDREFSVDGALYCGRCHKHYIPDDCKEKK